MRAEDEGGGPPPGTANPPTDPHQQDQAFFESNCDGRHDGSTAADFVLRLVYLGDVAIWTARPGADTEFIRPKGWQKLDASGNVDRLGVITPAWPSA